MARRITKEEMAIKVTYRRTSRLSMRIVKNGDVHVSAPIGMPREKVMAFIEEHKDWINEAKKKTYERQKQRAEFFEKLPLVTRVQADEALKRLKALVEPMMERHAKEMGVKPSIVYYKPTISRWGQCNVKDRSICISAYVLLLPEWCQAAAQFQESPDVLILDAIRFFHLAVQLLHLFVFLTSSMIHPLSLQPQV